MTILQKSLGARIFIAVCSFIGTIFCLGCACFFIAEHIGFLPLVLFFSIGLGIAFLAAGINVLMARIEYDDEKLITRSFKKQKVIYFKDINSNYIWNSKNIKITDLVILKITVSGVVNKHKDIHIVCVSHFSNSKSNFLKAFGSPTISKDNNSSSHMFYPFS